MSVRPALDHAFPIPPVDRLDPALLRRFRLLPLQVVLDGWLIYAHDTETLALSSPKAHRPPPDQTDTVYLSLTDYRRVTKAIADAEAA